MLMDPPNPFLPSTGVFDDDLLYVLSRRQHFRQKLELPVEIDVLGPDQDSFDVTVVEDELELLRG